MLNLEYAFLSDELLQKCLSSVHAWQLKWQERKVNGRAYIVVPDSIKLQIEKAYLNTYATDSLLLADVLSMESLASKILTYKASPQQNKAYLNSSLQRIFLKAILEDLRDKVKVSYLEYKGNSDILQESTIEANDLSSTSKVVFFEEEYFRVFLQDKNFVFKKNLLFLKKDLSFLYLNELLEKFTFIRSVGLDEFFATYFTEQEKTLSLFLEEQKNSQKLNEESISTFFEASLDLEETFYLSNLYQYFRMFLAKEHLFCDYEKMSQAEKILEARSEWTEPLSEYLEESHFFVYGFASSRHLNAREWSFLNSLSRVASSFTFFLLGNDFTGKTLLENNKLDEEQKLPFLLSSAFDFSNYWGKKLAKNNYKFARKGNDFKLKAILPAKTKVLFAKDKEDTLAWATELIKDALIEDEVRLSDISILSYLSETENLRLIQTLEKMNLAVYRADVPVFSETSIYSFLILFKEIILSLKLNRFNESDFLAFLTHPFFQKSESFWQREEKRSAWHNLIYFENLHTCTDLFYLFKKLAKLKAEIETNEQENIPSHILRFLEVISLDVVLELNSFLKSLENLVHEDAKFSWRENLAYFFDFIKRSKIAQNLEVSRLSLLRNDKISEANYLTKQWKIFTKILEHFVSLNFFSSLTFIDFLKTFLLNLKDQTLKEVPPIKEAIYLGNISDILTEKRKYTIVLGASSDNFPRLHHLDSKHLMSLKNACQFFFADKEVESDKISTFYSKGLKVPYPDSSKNSFATRGLAFYNLIEQTKKTLIFLQNEQDNSPKKYFDLLREMYQLSNTSSSFCEEHLKLSRKDKYYKTPWHYFKALAIKTYQADFQKKTEEEILTHRFKHPTIPYLPLTEKEALTLQAWLSFVLVKDDSLYFSASQIEEYRQSPYLYFLKRLLGMQERQDRKSLNNLKGSLLHCSFEDVLSKYFLEGKKPDFLMALPDRSLFYQDKEDISINFANNYLAIQDNLTSYLNEVVATNKQFFIYQQARYKNNDLRLIRRNLAWDFYQTFIQLQDDYRTRGDLYLPAKFEYAFKCEKHLVDIFPSSFFQTFPHFSDKKLCLRGFIDRIDYLLPPSTLVNKSFISEEDLRHESSYFTQAKADNLWRGFRVVDYKSGNQEIDKEKLKVGLDLQMPLYLWALSEINKEAKEYKEFKGLKIDFRPLDCAYTKIAKDFLKGNEEYGKFFLSYQKDLWLLKTKDSLTDEVFYKQLEERVAEQIAITLKYFKESVKDIYSGNFQLPLRLIDKERNELSEIKRRQLEFTPSKKAEDSYLYKKLLPFCSPQLEENEIVYLTPNKEEDETEDEDKSK